MNGYRNILRIVSVLMLCVMLAVIWALTVQTPAETTGLSGCWAFLFSRFDAVGIEQADLMVRKIAHVAEFFPVGILAALCVFSFLDERVSARKLIVIAISVCLACSLGDQVHKLFVPGREFDARDLLCDAIGYLSGVTVAYFACKALRRRSA